MNLLRSIFLTPIVMFKILINGWHDWRLNRKAQWRAQCYVCAKRFAKRVTVEGGWILRCKEHSDLKKFPHPCPDAKPSTYVKVKPPAIPAHLKFPKKK